jgi:hypothetical protein
MYDVEDAFKLLNPCVQELTINHLVEIRDQSALDKGENPAHEPKERTIMVLKLTEGLGLIEACSEVFEDIDLNEQ